MTSNLKNPIAGEWQFVPAAQSAVSAAESSTPAGGASPSNVGEVAALSASSVSASNLRLGLLAAPMVMGGRRRGRRRIQQRFIAKYYNEVASRPVTRGPTPETSIVVDMNYPNIYFAGDATLPKYFALSMSLSSFDNYSKYVALFDQYRFDFVEIWIDPLQVFTNQPYAPFVAAVDLDDDTTPVSFANVDSHQQALSGTGAAGRYFKFKPHMAVAVYNGTFTGYSNAPADWIDANSPNVKHYGLKMAAMPGTPNAWNLTVRARMRFRGPGNAGS